jgi:acyl carrier protein
MVPAEFVELDRLPLNPNGKVDRKALPAPDQHRPELEAGFLAPRTPVEELLAGIWCEVLGLGRVGIHDNFFELGGHSLLATRVVAKVREALAVELPLRLLFETPTVAGLAAVVDGQYASSREPPLRPINDGQAAPKLEDLSDEAIDGMLATLLAEQSRAKRLND